jgi:hypothetical protein
MLDKSVEEVTKAELRAVFKEILNSCYHFNTAEFKATKESKYVRLNMYLALIINIDKVYLQRHRDIWNPYF